MTPDLAPAALVISIVAVVISSFAAFMSFRADRRADHTFKSQQVSFALNRDPDPTNNNWYSLRHTGSVRIHQVEIDPSSMRGIAVSFGTTRAFRLDPQEDISFLVENSIKSTTEPLRVTWQKPFKGEAIVRFPETLGPKKSDD